MKAKTILGTVGITFILAIAAQAILAATGRISATAMIDSLAADAAVGIAAFMGYVLLRRR